MAWATPKTDWYGAQDADGNYTGDRFNAKDYNRIKNNLAYLRSLAIELYEPFSINFVSFDKASGDFFYAKEINQMEMNLEIINKNTFNFNIGDTKSYYSNGHTFDFDELNRLEKATLKIYENLINERDGRRMFTWNFGMKGASL